MRLNGRGFTRVLSIVAIFAAVFGPLLQMQTVNAAQITNRSLTLQAGANGDGGSLPGGIVNHILTFTVPSNVAVGSILFQYCTTATGGTCTMPTGMDSTLSGSPSTTLGTTTGISGYTLDKTTNGAPYIKNAGTPTVTGAVTVPLNNVKNPTTNNSSFFVRISTYTSTNATGTPIDTGTVTAAVTNPIVLTGIMPESLIFCAATTIGVNGGGIPDCSTATTGVVSFNQLFSPTDTATATSQMAASTNAGAGYNITVNGATLTSGANTIPAMAVAATGSHGVGQFGMNLKANTTATSTTAVGTEVAPAADGTTYRGEALAGYNTADTFKFATGNSVADSANGSPGPTNSQIFTASYIVNVPGNQPAGTYATTLTYVCTATF